MSGRWYLRSDPDWPPRVPADPEAVLNAQLTDRHCAKQGRSIARWALGNGRLVVYLKRHHRESWWRGLMARVTRRPNWSAAWQEYKRLKRAHGLGVVVPRAVAVGAKVGPGCNLQGYLAIEELAGQVPLNELIPRAAATLPPRVFHVWKQGLVAELARLTWLLHGRRWFHKDLYLCHFYAPETFAASVPTSWTGRIALIDLHRFARHPLAWRWWQCKDLAQLLYSSDVPGLTARDRVRFWRLYAGPDRRHGFARVLRYFVRFRWRNYRAHNARRKAAA